MNKVHRKFEVHYISTKRVLCKTTCDAVSEYLKENKVYVTSNTGYNVRLGSASKKFDSTIVDLESVPKYARQLWRVCDQLRGERHIDSLATEQQLARVKEFYKLLAKRKDNKLVPPNDLDTYTHGEIGRLKADLEAILVKEGMWDPISKTAKL